MSDTTIDLSPRVLNWRNLGALSVGETAQVLGVSEPTVRRLIEDHALESVQGLGPGSRRTVPVWSIRKYLREEGDGTAQQG